MLRKVSALSVAGRRKDARVFAGLRVLLPYCVSVVSTLGCFAIACYREISPAGQENPFEPLDHLEEESGCNFVAVLQDRCRQAREDSALVTSSARKREVEGLRVEDSGGVGAGGSGSRSVEVEGVRAGWSGSVEVEGVRE